MSQLMTLAQLSRMLTVAPISTVYAWHPALLKAYTKHLIDNDPRQAAQMASGINETGGYTVFFEATYFYTPWSRISAIFGGVRGLTAELVTEWKKLGEHGFDVAFFNHVYDDANRNPGYRLGNTQPGDGWKYRGMGPGAITGRGNYTWLQNRTGINLLDNPEIIATPEVGAEIMAYFWNLNNLNAAVDDGSEAGFMYAMRRLNAGLQDFSHHLAYWRLTTAVMANDEIPERAPAPIPMRARSDAVKDMQARLVGKGWDTKGIDGMAGPGTMAAIAGFEESAGLNKDGLVDDDMLGALRKRYLGLRRGAKDTAMVGEFQQRLIEAGANLAPYGGADGDFGYFTETELINYQKRRNIRPTGYVGAATLADLKLAA